MGRRRAIYPDITPPPPHTHLNHPITCPTPTFGSLVQLPPSQQISPNTPPQDPGAVKAPRTVVLSVSQPPPPLSLHPSVSLALLEIKHSQLLLRSGRAAAGLAEQTEEPRTCEADGVRFV